MIARFMFFYKPGVTISAGKAVSDRIYRLVGELSLDWIFSCINRGKIHNMVGSSVTHRNYPYNGHV